MKKLLAVLTLAAIAAAPASPVTTLAGRYFFTLPDPGTKKPLDNILEIVPVDAGHAYVRFSLAFPNGFSCGLWGVARADGDQLVYRAAKPDPDSGARCTLTIKAEGKDLTFSDGDDSSCHSYCGMNGEMSGDFALSSRRPITYLPRLKGSREYRDALAELARQPKGY